jgi:hypothetical protein
MLYVGTYRLYVGTYKLYVHAPCAHIHSAPSSSCAPYCENENVRDSNIILESGDFRVIALQVRGPY